MRLEMETSLTGKRVAILVENGFEQSELERPKRALEEAGAETKIVSPAAAQVRGWQHTNWGDWFPIDIHLEEASANDYDALLLPGGVMNPDKLRMNRDAVSFVRGFFEQNKPI